MIWKLLLTLQKDIHYLEKWGKCEKNKKLYCLTN